LGVPREISKKPPWAATGYGTQTAQVTQRLKEIGHDVAIFSNYGLEGSNNEWNGIPVLTPDTFLQKFLSA
jgi:hypothetical protein